MALGNPDNVPKLADQEEPIVCTCNGCGAEFIDGKDGDANIYFDYDVCFECSAKHMKRIDIPECDCDGTEDGYHVCLPHAIHAEAQDRAIHRQRLENRKHCQPERTRMAGTRADGSRI